MVLHFLVSVPLMVLMHDISFHLLREKLNLRCQDGSDGSHPRLGIDTNLLEQIAPRSPDFHQSALSSRLLAPENVQHVLRWSSSCILIRLSSSPQVEKSLQRIQSGQCNPMYTSQQSVENKVCVSVFTSFKSLKSHLVLFSHQISINIWICTLSCWTPTCFSTSHTEYWPRISFRAASTIHFGLFMFTECTEQTSIRQMTGILHPQVVHEV